jgi:hypothetical protein
MDCLSVSRGEVSEAHVLMGLMFDAVLIIRKSRQLELLEAEAKGHKPRHI